MNDITPILRKKSRKEVVQILMILAPLFVLNLAGILASCYLLASDGFKTKLLASLVIQLALLIILICALRAINESFIFRIVPFFSRRLNAKVFGCGRRTLENLKLLDAIAEENRLAGISTFLYPTYFLTPKDKTDITWKDPSELYRTVVFLADSTRQIPTKFSYPDELANDLDLLKNALETCMQNGAQVVLVIREGMDRGISGWEMDRLKARFGGSFF
jgi:hypothetical protein